MRRRGKKLEIWKAPDGRDVEIRITPGGSFTAEVDDQSFTNDVKRDLINTLEDWFDEVKRLDWKPFILWRQKDFAGWDAFSPKFEFVWVAQQGEVRKFRKGLFMSLGLVSSNMATRREMPSIGPDAHHGTGWVLVSFTFERWEACQAMSRQARDLKDKSSLIHSSPSIEKIIDGVASGAIRLSSVLLEAVSDEGEDYSDVVDEIEKDQGAKS